MSYKGKSATVSESDNADIGRQRIDKWLFFTRIIKSREKSASLVKDGCVRVNGIRVTVPSKLIKVDDVLTVALERNVVVLRVLDVGIRRGPANEAIKLYRHESD